MTAWVVNQQVPATRRASRPATVRPATDRPASRGHRSTRPEVARAASSLTAPRHVPAAACSVTVPVRPTSAVAARPAGELRLTPRGLAVVTVTMLFLMLVSLATVLGQFWMISG